MSEKLATAQHFKRASNQKSPKVLQHAVHSIQKTGGEVLNIFADTTQYAPHEVMALANGDQKISKEFGNQSLVQKGLKAVADHLGTFESKEQDTQTFSRPSVECAIA